MRILRGEFIEFGDFVIANDKYPIAIVSGHYEIIELKNDLSKGDTINNWLNSFDWLDFDWIDLDSYRGEIVFKLKGIQ